MNSTKEKQLFQKRLVRLFGVENQQEIGLIVDKHYSPGERDNSKQRFIDLVQKVRFQLKDVGRHQPFFINNQLKNFSHIKETVNDYGIIKDQGGKKKAEEILKSKIHIRRENQRQKFDQAMQDLRSSLAKTVRAELKNDILKNRSLKPKKKPTRKSIDHTGTLHDNAVFSVTQLKKIHKFLREELASEGPNVQIPKGQTQGVGRSSEKDKSTPNQQK